MKLQEIKEKYEKRFNDYLPNCINNIDHEMILLFKQIEKTKRFSILERNVISSSTYVIPSDIKEDVILGIKEHYQEEWHVTFVCQKWHSGEFRFRLKEPVNFLPAEEPRELDL